MPSSRLNVLIPAFLLVMTMGAGTYVTFVHQPHELARADEAEKALALERSELLGLTTSESRMMQEIEYASQRWQARYKNVEDSLSTADVVDYVNRFADSGFEMLNVEFGGHQQGLNHQYFAFNVTGRGPFEHLYRFLWHMENNRKLYRIEDLMIDGASEDSSGGVQFSFRLLAYFRIPGSFAAIDDAGARPEASDVPDVPEDVLPARRLPIDPFSFARPASGGASQAPRLVSLRGARLVSIAGNMAAFDVAGKIRRFRVGDQVHEGRIEEVNAARQHVAVVDDAGETHTFRMEAAEPYLLSKGSNRIVPIGG